MNVPTAFFAVYASDTVKRSRKKTLQHSLAEEPTEKVAVVPEKADVCELAGSFINY